MSGALKPIGPTARRISEDTAKRLIAEAEAKGQHEHAEALRRVWRDQIETLRLIQRQHEARQDG